MPIQHRAFRVSNKKPNDNHSVFYFLRRRRDSNSRYPFGYSGFQDRCIQPLCHASKPLSLTRDQGLPGGTLMGFVAQAQLHQAVEGHAPQRAKGRADPGRAEVVAVHDGAFAAKRQTRMRGGEFSQVAGTPAELGMRVPHGRMQCRRAHGHPAQRIAQHFRAGRCMLAKLAQHMLYLARRQVHQHAFAQQQDRRATAPLRQTQVLPPAGYAQVQLGMVLALAAARQKLAAQPHDLGHVSVQPMVGVRVQPLKVAAQAAAQVDAPGAGVALEEIFRQASDHLRARQHAEHARPVLEEMADLGPGVHLAQQIARKRIVHGVTWE